MREPSARASMVRVEEMIIRNLREIFLILWASLLWGAPIGWALDLSTVGTPSDRGALIAVQPEMSPSDYRSEEAFYQKTRSYLEKIKKDQPRALSPNSAVVFPEYYGFFLIVADEWGWIYGVESSQTALLGVVLRHSLETARYWSESKEQDAIQAAVLRAQAKKVAGIYERVFSKIAREFGVNLVGGSLVLPGAEVRDGKIQVDPSAGLQNVTFLIRPDGQVDSKVVRKVVLVSGEEKFLSPSRWESIPIFEIGSGKAKRRLGVLICADSWFPQGYAQFKASQVDWIAAPAFMSQSGLAGQPWGGYVGAPTPADVDPADPKRLTEAQAWSKYTIPGRLAQSGADLGVVPFLRGKFWDIGSDGQSLVAGEGAPKSLGESIDRILLVWAQK